MWSHGKFEIRLTSDVVDQLYEVKEVLGKDEMTFVEFIEELLQIAVEPLFDLTNSEKNAL